MFLQWNFFTMNFFYNEIFLQWHFLTMKFYNAIFIFYNNIFSQWNFTMQFCIFFAITFFTMTFSYNEILQCNCAFFPMKFFTMTFSYNEILQCNCAFLTTRILLLKNFIVKKLWFLLQKKVGHPELLGSSTGSLVGYYSGGPAGQASAFIKPNPSSSRRSPSSSFSNLTLDYRFNYVTYLIT